MEFSDFFQSEFPRLVRLTYLVMGDPGGAEDIAQEAFVRLFQRWKRISRYEQPEAWLRLVALRLARRRRVQHSRELAYDAERIGPVPESGAHDVLRLRNAIRNLPYAQRAAIVLHYFEDRPLQQIAELLGCSPSTARVHLFRGRKRLERLLGEEMTDAV